MKTRIAGITLLSLMLIAFTLMIVGCITAPQYTKADVIYAQWKAEQKAQNDALVKYTQSPEYVKQYTGVSKANSLPGAKANSVVGTKDDPFANIRRIPYGTPITTVPIDYRITIRY